MATNLVFGRQAGMVVAFLVAAAMNLFAYWDKMVLQYGAREANVLLPSFTGSWGSWREGGAADAAGLHHGQSTAERLRPGTQLPSMPRLSSPPGLLQRLNRDELAGLPPCAIFRSSPSRFQIRRPSAIPLPPISSSSTRFRAREWTISSLRIPMLRTASRG
jgi:hypothetical protein